MTSEGQALVVGAGIMGAVAALELDRRGWRITLLDQGEIPHPLAASTDISKVCRMEYGPDEHYMALMETAREGWLEWNRRWSSENRDLLYHETGVVMVCLDEMAPDGFEHESFELLKRRGHSPERIGGARLVERFAAWDERFVDGFFHAKGGWAESGRVVIALIEEARARGVEIVEGERVSSLVESSGGVAGVSSARGTRFDADTVVLTGGSWVGELLPELTGSLARSYHPVWHLRPEDPTLFEAERFPVFTADVARTGFYGFPLHPREGVVKIGHHGVGVEPSVGPEGDDLVVPGEITAGFRSFLAENLPSLAPDLSRAEIVKTRLCPYCDTPDEDLWIASDPERDGLTVASGGSGHAFKFAPALGAIIADAVEGERNAYSEKFRWRPELELARGLEAARCHEDAW
ncbi:MAG: FAD-dependent oxidoreductase [Thermoanaerobaculia bacterium]